MNPTGCAREIPVKRLARSFPRLEGRYDNGSKTGDWRELEPDGSPSKITNF